MHVYVCVYIYVHTYTCINYRPLCRLYICIVYLRVYLYKLLLYEATNWTTEESGFHLSQTEIILFFVASNSIWGTPILQSKIIRGLFAVKKGSGREIIPSD
jgi:hypothetical protein